MSRLALALAVLTTLVLEIKSQLDPPKYFHVGKDKSEKSCVAESPSPELPLCDGSLEKPYSSLIQAISEIERNYQRAAAVVIYLLDKVMVLNSIIARKYYPEKEHEEFFRVRGSILSLPQAIHILPFDCSRDPDFSCSAARDKVQIQIKGQDFLFTFMATGLLHFENVIFNGQDMNVDEDYLSDFNDPSCFETATICCTTELLVDEQIYSAQCFIKSLQPSRGDPRVSSSFFLLGQAKNSSLVIRNCEFEFFNEARMNYRYGNLIDTFVLYPFNLKIENTIFRRCYFEKGLVTLMGPAISKNKYRTTPPYVPSNLTLKDVIFREYNFYDFQESKANNAYVITLKDIGSIEASNIIFIDAARLLRIQSNNEIPMLFTRLFIGDIEKVANHQIMSIEKNIQITFKDMYFEDVQEEQTQSTEDYVTEDDPVESLFKVNTLNRITFQDCYFGSIVTSIGIFDVFYLNKINFTRSLFFSIKTMKKAILGGFQNNSFTIFDCHFVEVESSETASLLYLYALNEVDIKISYFHGLQSTDPKGNIFLYSLNKMVIESAVMLNFSVTESGAIGLCSKSNTIVMRNSEFGNSKSDSMAGGFFLTLNNSLVVDNCTFKNFYAPSFGGVFFAQEKNLLVINQSSFFNSSTLTWGGAILIFLANTLELFACKFKTNHAENGAAMYLKKDNELKVFNCSFENNLARISGGALYFWQGNFLFLSNSSFQQNVALSGQGGSLCFGENQTARMQHILVNQSWSDLEGGAFYLKDFNDLSLKNIDASRVTGLSGGFLYASSMNKIIMELSKLHDLESLKSGGCFYSRKQNEIMITNSVFTNITSKLSGTISYLDELNTVLIFSSSFFNISSKYSGGAIHSGDFNYITINQTSLQNISSQLNGGTIYLGYKNNLVVSKLNLRCAASQWEGGFIFAGDRNSINISNSEFFLVGSADEGGVFYLLQNNDLVLNSSLFSYTFSLAAGVLYASLANQVLVSGCQVYFLFTFLEGRFAILYNNNSMSISSTSFNFSKSISEEVLFMRLEPNQTNRNDTSFLINSSYGKSKVLLDRDQTSTSVFFVRTSSIKLKNLNLTNLFDSTIVRLRSSVLNDSKGLKITDCNFLDNFLFDIKSSIVVLSHLFLKSNTGSVFNLLMSTMNLTKYRIFSNGSTLIDSLMSFLSLYDGRLATSYSNKRYGVTIFQTFVSLKDSILYLNQSEFRGYKFNPDLIITMINMTNSDLYATSVVFKEVHSPYGSGAIEAKYIGDILMMSISDLVKPKWVIKIDKCLFALNRGFEGGAIRVMRRVGDVFFKVFFLKRTSLEIKDSLFIANSAHFGGALYLDNIDVITINRTKFKSNVCQQYDKSAGPSKGGALFSNSKTAFMDVSGADFSHNRADVGGGLFWKGGFVLSEEELKENNNSFINNTAGMYGPDYSSSLKYLKFNYTEPFIFDANTKKNLSVLDKLLGGYNYTECLLYLIPFDTFDQVTYCAPEEYPAIVENFTKLPLSQMINDIFCLKGVFDRTRYIQNDSIVNYKEVPIKVNLTEYNKAYQLTVVQNFRDCKLGERLTDDLRCIKCMPNSYSFERTFLKTSDQCRSCYGQPFNCYGGSDITPKPGYWRVSVESNIFLKCPLDKACVGDDGKGTFDPAKALGVCHKGFKGQLCSQCEEGYGLTSDMKCAECDDFSQIFMFILVVTLKLSFIIYTIHKSLVMCMTISSDNVDINEVISSNLLKILTNHLQCLLIIFSLPINWPIEFWRDISIVSSPSITKGSSLDCFLSRLGIQLSNHYTRIIMMWFHPFLLVLICIIYVKLYKRITGGRSLRNVPQSFLSLFQPLLCIVLLISYADFISICLELFKCIDIGYEGHPEIRMAKDYSIICWTEEHMFWIFKVMLPFLIVFGFGVPMFIIVKLSSKSTTNRLHEPKILFKYGYFYYACESKYFYWDFVILLRKIFLTFFGIYFIRTDIQTEQNFFAVLLILAVLLMSLYIHVLNTPYRKNKIDVINDIEKKSLMSLSGSVFFGLMSLNKESQFFENESILYMFMIFVTNFFFFLPWIRAFINFNAIYIYYDIKQIAYSALARIRIFMTARHDSKEKLLADSSNPTDSSFSLNMTESMQIREEEAQWIDDKDERIYMDRPRRARTFSTKRTMIRGRNRVIRQAGPKNNKANQSYKKKYQEMKKRFKELEVVTKIVTLENQKLKKKLTRAIPDSPDLPRKARTSAFLELSGKEVVTPQIRDNIIYGKKAGLIKKQLIEMKKINLENRLRLKLCSLLRAESVLYRDQMIEIRSSTSIDMSSPSDESGRPVINIKLVVRNVSATKIFSSLRLTFSENKRNKEFIII